MSYDEARMSGQHVMSGGTAYMLGTHGRPTLGGSMEGSELERCFMRRNISRCCDGDDHTAQATLPDRYTTTVEDALNWYERLRAAMTNLEARWLDWLREGGPCPDCGEDAAPVGTGRHAIECRFRLIHDLKTLSEEEN